MVDKLNEMDLSVVLKVTENEEKQLVSARDLYDFLEIKERFGAWTNRMFSYGLQEHRDYEKVVQYVECNNGIGGVNKIDYALTIEAAKEIAMVQRTEKGKMAREYFIKCEQALKKQLSFETPKDYLSALKALVEAEETKMKALEEIKENKRVISTQASYIKSNNHKVVFYDDCVTDEDDSRFDMNSAAKVVMDTHGGGRNRMMNILRHLNILLPDNTPYMRYVNSGYFTLKVTRPKDKYGHTKICTSTLVTNKGLGFLKKVIDKYFQNLAKIPISQ